MTRYAPLLCTVLAALTLAGERDRPLLADDWVIASQDQWTAAVADPQQITIEDGVITPTTNTTTLRSVLHHFDTPRDALSIVVEQSPLWQNWEPTENVGPRNLGDAPVLLSLGPDNYWMFGRYGGQRRKDFTPQPASLEGFDVPLQTTPFPNQFD